MFCRHTCAWYVCDVLPCYVYSDALKSFSFPLRETKQRSAMVDLAAGGMSGMLGYLCHIEAGVFLGLHCSFSLL